MKYGNFQLWVRLFVIPNCAYLAWKVSSTDFYEYKQAHFSSNRLYREENSSLNDQDPFQRPL